MKKPNLVYIFADQWRGQSIGVRDREVITPNMDKFVKESLYYIDAVSTCPLCSPYRACLFTSKYPEEHGVYGNCMTGYPIALAEEEHTLTDILHENGYYNGYIGKWHLDEPELNFTSSPHSGAKGWDAFTPKGKKRHNIDYWYAYNADNNHFAPHYWEDSDEKIVINEWSATHETDKAISFIEDNKDKPFSLFLSLNPPHPPYHLVPEKYRALYPEEIKKRANFEGVTFKNHTRESDTFSLDHMEEIYRDYYAAISGLDEQFGRLIETLKRNNLYEDTIIVLTSDHGDMLGSHSLVGKHVWYEESINVPFVIRYGHHLKEGVDFLQFSTVNIMPMLLRLMDIKCDKKVIENDPVNNEKDYSVISSYISRDVFIDSFAAENTSPLDTGWRAIRTKEYKLVAFRGYMPTDESELILYDRINDPLENNGLRLSFSNIDSPVALELLSLLQAHLERYNPGFNAWLKAKLEQR